MKTKKPKGFKQLEKEPLTFQLPPELAGLVREKATKERKSLSLMGTEVLSEFMGINPSKFGIERAAV